MRVYKSKEELKAEINKTFEKYISEFDCIPEALKDKRAVSYTHLDVYKRQRLPLRQVEAHIRQCRPVRAVIGLSLIHI